MFGGGNMNVQFDLERLFVAQDAGETFEEALRELRSGRKTSHWMWFVFPQIKGLGHSPMAERFAISGGKEAEAYADHPIFGPRLNECPRLGNAIDGRSISQIFGAPDDLKFRSSMTLFAEVCKDNEPFV